MKAVGRFLEDWAPDTNDQVRSWKLKTYTDARKRPRFGTALIM